MVPTRRAMDVMSGTDIDRLQAELEAVHLPLLDEADVIDWDPATGTVSMGEEFETAESIIREFER